jgi:hypothetical protein
MTEKIELIIVEAESAGLRDYGGKRTWDCAAGITLTEHLNDMHGLEGMIVRGSPRQCPYSRFTALRYATRQWPGALSLATATMPAIVTAWPRLRDMEGDDRQ